MTNLEHKEKPSSQFDLEAYCDIQRWQKLFQQGKEHGLFYVATSRTAGIIQRLRIFLATCFRGWKTFNFAGKKYRYCLHPYNISWMCERTVEIPVAWDWVQQYQGKKILEIGNVLSHYFDVSHDVVDKYEQAPGILNQDVLNFAPPRREYDLIISVSTLEHVGFDEAPRDPDKILAALKNIRTFLAPQGRLIFTFALGYNTNLDALLFAGRLGTGEVRFIKRISLFNTWAETNRQDAMTARYGAPFPRGNTVAICFEKRA